MSPPRESRFFSGGKQREPGETREGVVKADESPRGPIGDREAFLNDREESITCGQPGMDLSHPGLAGMGFKPNELHFSVQPDPSSQFHFSFAPAQDPRQAPRSEQARLHSPETVINAPQGADGSHPRVHTIISEPQNPAGTQAQPQDIAVEPKSGHQRNRSAESVESLEEHQEYYGRVGLGKKSPQPKHGSGTPTARRAAKEVFQQVSPSDFVKAIARVDPMEERVDRMDRKFNSLDAKVLEIIEKFNQNMKTSRNMKSSIETQGATINAHVPTIKAYGAKIKDQGAILGAVQYLQSSADRKILDLGEKVNNLTAAQHPQTFLSLMNKISELEKKLASLIATHHPESLQSLMDNKFLELEKKNTSLAATQHQPNPTPTPTPIVTPASQEVPSADAGLTHPDDTQNVQTVTNSGGLTTRPRSNVQNDDSMPQGKKFSVYASPQDDVFATTFVARAQSMFDQKTYSELIGAQCVKVENFVRMWCVMPFSTRIHNQGVHRLVDLARGHVDNKRMAIMMLENTESRVFLVSGIINRLLCQECYEHPILNCFESQYSYQYTAIWEEEERSKGLMAPYGGANNYPRRLALAEERVRVTSLITKLPGFWKWVQSQAHALTASILQELTTLLPPNAACYGHFYSDLYPACHDALKIAIRMRLEPKCFEPKWFSSGCSWDFKNMIQRNPELRGRTCDEEPPIFVVRCTVAPFIREKNFETSEWITLQKGEVLLCDRKKNLR